MKKGLLLTLGGILLFLFIIVTSLIWYNVFYEKKGTDVSVLEIHIDKEKEATINESNAIPLTEEEGSKVIPYSFKVKNSSNSSGFYQVLIEDAIMNNSNKTLLSRSQLEYQLLLNSKMIKKGKLSKIKDNILDERNIANGEENNYELRVYVSSDAADTAWQNKYYHYKINIQTLEENK